MPLDLETAHLPAKLQLTDEENGIDYHMLLNWGDTTRTFTVSNSKKKKAIGHWTGKDYGKDKSIEITLTPHEAELLVLE